MAGIDQGPNEHGVAPGCTTYSYVYIGTNTSSSKVGNPLTNQASTSLSCNLLLDFDIHTLKSYLPYSKTNVFCKKNIQSLRCVKIGFAKT